MMMEKSEERSCNCRNSKCMKLYCECYSAKVACGKSCHCLDCQNRGDQNIKQGERRVSREELIRVHKGCACRRSGCTKKYCECFQSGLLCRDTCKCMDCQNNESLTNRKVINQLRRSNSIQSNAQNNITLYPLYLSQNSEHLHSIISQANPLGLHDNWLQGCANFLYQTAIKGDFGQVIDKFIEVLTSVESNIIKQQGLRVCHQPLSDEVDHELFENGKDQDKNDEKLKIEKVKVEKDEEEEEKDEEIGQEGVEKQGIVKDQEKESD